MSRRKNDPPEDYPTRDEKNSWSREVDVVCGAHDKPSRIVKLGVLFDITGPDPEGIEALGPESEAHERFVVWPGLNTDHMVTVLDPEAAYWEEPDGETTVLGRPGDRLHRVFALDCKRCRRRVLFRAAKFSYALRMHAARGEKRFDVSAWDASS